MKEYKKYEFCKSVGCIELTKKEPIKCGAVYKCVYTAREFHRWLKNNGYKILKD